MSSLHVDFSQTPDALLRFAFAPSAAVAATDPITVACPHLAGPTLPETWHGQSEQLRAVCIHVPEQHGDIETAARIAYQQLLAAVRHSSHPFLLRIWNYLDAINEGEGDDERYRRFCLGRAAAVDNAFNNPPPAATGIGHIQRTGHVHVIALCAAAPAQALENPRQTPAWRYPRDYGPVAPGFSRGALLDHGRCLLASGTASIVGHRSLHEGCVGAQTREALANLHALLQQASAQSGAQFNLTSPDALRIYLRHSTDLDTVRDEINRAGLPQDRIVYLHGDICRRELLMELEGVFTARA